MQIAQITMEISLGRKYVDRLCMCRFVVQEVPGDDGIPGIAHFIVVEDLVEQKCKLK